MSKIGSAVSEEKSFENVNRRTDDGRKVIKIAHPEQSSGELKIHLESEKSFLLPIYGFNLCQAKYFVCVEVLQPSQPNGVMSNAVSLPNHTFTGQA